MKNIILQACKGGQLMIRVLLVDDEEDALNLLEILLHQAGDVEIAGRFVNPVHAIEALNAAHVDAVFLDIEMPGMTGMATARKMREIQPHLQIIFTTAHAEYAVEAFEIQSTDYLLKPLAPDRLQQAVSRIRQAGHAAFRTQDRSDVSIRCMGGFSIALPHDAGRPLTWKTNKEKEICAFLVHHEGKHVDTAFIIESVWPGHDLKKAKTYLYTCLSYLRKSFQEHQVPMNIDKAGNGFAIRLNGASADVTELEALLDGILSAEEPDERLYGRINDLYKGEYMEGCDYLWAAFRQETVNAKYLRALRSMHLHFRNKGNAVMAQDCLQRVLSIAPDSEADGRALIRLHMEEGNRSEALRVYRQLEHVIQDQLGVALEEETKMLYRQMGWTG
jgi:two-component SAPR family response regulator